jgi:hypothetical protein
METSPPGPLSGAERGSSIAFGRFIRHRSVYWKCRDHTSLLFCDGGDISKDELQPLLYVVVRDTENTQVTTGEDLVAGLVVSPLLVVDDAVHLDHGTCCTAVEVRDKAVDDLLPAES